MTTKTPLTNDEVQLIAVTPSLVTKNDASFTTAASDAGKTWVNTYTSGVSNWTLHAAAAGFMITAMNASSSQSLRITPNSADRIWIANTGTPASTGYLQIGPMSLIRLTKVTSTVWIAEVSAEASFSDGASRGTANLATLSGLATWHASASNYSDSFDIAEATGTFTVADGLIISGNSACFPAGAMIETDSNGQIGIEKIVAGMYITTFNPVGGKTLAPVEKVRIHEGSTDFITFETDNGLSITATPNHPIWCDELGFVPCFQIQERMHLRRANGDKAQVFRINPERRKPQNVYDLSLPKNTSHTYIVNGFIVHNK